MNKKMRGKQTVVQGFDLDQFVGGEVLVDDRGFVQVYEGERSGGEGAGE